MREALRGKPSGKLQQVKILSIAKGNLKLLIFLKISQSFGVKIIVMQHPKTNFQNQFSSFGQTDLGLPNIKIFAKI